MAAAVIAGRQNMFVQGIFFITFPATFINSSAQIANISFHLLCVYEISRPLPDTWIVT